VKRCQSTTIPISSCEANTSKKEGEKEEYTGSAVGKSKMMHCEEP